MHKSFLSILILFSFFGYAQNHSRDLSKENWTFKKEGDNKYYKASIPGTVHTDLFQNQLIPDPFFGTNEKELQWIENENWQYETNFTLSTAEHQNQNIDIEFQGLDTYATVFLNGKVVLEANNMFRKWTISAKKHLKKGNNHLKIIFYSAVKKGKEAALKLPYTLPEKERVFVRKAQYQFGWDWAPRLVTAGIWKNVALKFWNSATIKSATYEQISLTDTLARLNFKFLVQVDKPQYYDFVFDEKPHTFYLKKGLNSIFIPFKHQNPLKWWCNGLGEPVQYSYQFSLMKDTQIIQNIDIKVGFRTIELVQEKDSKGTSFYFKLNGIPVFIKGANYVPQNSFLPNVSGVNKFELVQQAKKSNMNMLRVWGGGVYGDDDFYDACDANGILVWQDFMFACAMYPGDKKFIDNVKQEVIDNVTRLQGHPSLALWCGNNENDEGWHNWGWQKQFNYSKADSTQIWNDYKKVFHEMIPKTLDSILPRSENRYWSSSPSKGWGRKESLTQGDVHYWGVWWGKEPFEIYKKKVGRFVSEYGFQGMSNLKTVQSVVHDDELNLQSESIKNHQKHPTGYETINEYMQRDYIVPTKFEDYLYVSQLLQSEGMKTAIEAHRRAKPYCMGTLYWQLNDCWPVTSWSSIDFYGRWKALHYQVKRSFENQLISFDEDENDYLIYLINDDVKPINGALEVVVFDFRGKILWKSNAIVKADGNSSEIVYQIAKKEFNKFDLNNAVLQVSIATDKKTIQSEYYFVKPKELNLIKPSIKIVQIDETTIEVSSDVLAKNVFLSADEDVFFSDNYFDVMPNQKVIIKLSQPVKSISIKSLFDTFH